MATFNFIQILMYNLYASSVKPDQTPRSVASSLVLHCLPTPHKKDARFMWVIIERNHAIPKKWAIAFPLATIKDE